MEIIKTVSPRWKEVGMHLDFDATGVKLKQIEADNYREGVESCCQAMFQYWLEGNGVQPISWNTLIRILRNSSFNTLAIQLHTALRSP